MNEASFRARAYLRTDCPYSFKFLLFMSEARLLGEIELVRADPRKPHEYEAIKSTLAQSTGKKATFPTVEIERGVYRSDSNALIDHYAKKHGVATNSLTAFTFYLDGIFPQLDALHH
jgi:hypothetical protein